MNKRRVGIVAGIVCLLLIIGASNSLANSQNIVNVLFKDKKLKLENINEDDMVAKGQGFNISEKEYTDYKENLLIIHKLNDIPFELTSKEIINSMIENKILIQYAKKAKTTVTDEQIKEYALQTKEAVEQSEIPEIHAIHVELANNLNVSLEDYFNHPDVLKEYKNILLVENYLDQLYEKEILNDDYTVEDYVKELMKENESSLYINESLIKENKK